MKTVKLELTKMIVTDIYQKDEKSNQYTQVQCEQGKFKFASDPKVVDFRPFEFANRETYIVEVLGQQYNRDFSLKATSLKNGTK